MIRWDFVSWSTSEWRVRLAPLNRFKPSSKIFYWPFQGGTFLWIFYVFVLSCVCYLCARLFICALWSPAGKGLTSWLSFVVSAVSLSLSHWYPGLGVVLDCIDSWSLYPYLLCLPMNVCWKTIEKKEDEECDFGNRNILDWELYSIQPLCFACL